MELTLKGTPEEIAKMLQAIESSEEQNEKDISSSLGGQFFHQVLPSNLYQRESVMSLVRGESRNV
ncbi:hypothetical protein IW492_02950 [Enterococcus sp. BWB1-3]|uniref:hypothetical protein n=1 Tax=Enterococcus sp. BWB1-3 TaxID=2787713 RepID=UPI001924FCD7|nr:hypothetical protein [Enterococcus sp. BWB1-3]MBL1228190.1 hypothetical protein [Enterococcus sp. BWB1-3]